MKKMTVEISDTHHKKLKIKAAKDGTSVKEIINDLLKGEFDKSHDQKNVEKISKDQKNVEKLVGKRKF